MKSYLLYNVLWCSMMFDDVHWCSMMFYDVLWSSMIFYDVLWYSMMFYDWKDVFHHMFPRYISAKFTFLDVLFWHWVLVWDRHFCSWRVLRWCWPRRFATLQCTLVQYTVQYTAQDSTTHSAIQFWLKVKLSARQLYTVQITLRKQSVEGGGSPAEDPEIHSDSDFRVSKLKKKKKTISWEKNMTNSHWLLRR